MKTPHAVLCYALGGGENSLLIDLNGNSSSDTASWGILNDSYFMQTMVLIICLCKLINFASLQLLLKMSSI